MPKLRKMLGGADSPEALALMALMDTQSVKTLGAWAVGYAKEHYLELCGKYCPEDSRPRAAIDACGAYLQGGGDLKGVKALIKEAGAAAREAKQNPAAQAAARAVATACAAIHTPTSALGFLFYGAAAVAYDRAGLGEKAEVYDDMAAEEFKRALASLKQAAVPDEPSPARIKWYC